ncbi:hypothetical protein EG68_08787 [Paragonimus skrjabini miyazakii]|uniref:Uncharacterized protein n=1 Tax=Paragonimus skrjabini miyazakii TaxID=59628 RepID=A0A8S9YAI6_9TREM|nr:hypothetical protein EG68_08787 [Paragonimus skrjabini miyazakii]
MTVLHLRITTNIFRLTVFVIVYSFTTAHKNLFLLDDAVQMDYRTRIHLPADYDPLALINSYEGLCRFLASETSKPIELDLSIGSSETSTVVTMKALFDRDVEAIACFAVELYTHSVVNYSESDRWNHAKRVKVARYNARLYWDRIPYCLHQGLRLVLQPFADETQNVLSSDRFLPSTSQLLNVLFEFPSYMFDLHMVIQWLSDRRSGQLHPVITRPPFLWGPLAAAFISPTNETILDMTVSSNHISPNVLSLLYPHMRRTIKACPVWLLQSDRLLEFFASVGGALAVKNYLLPLFLSLFNAGSLMLSVSQSSGQHPLTVLCSKQFLRSLLTYVGCESFLKHLPIRIASALLSSPTDYTTNTLSDVKIKIGFESRSSMSYDTEDIVVSDVNQAGEIGLDVWNFETVDEVVERSGYRKREVRLVNSPSTVDNEESAPVPSISPTADRSLTTRHLEQPPAYVQHCPPSIGLSGLINSNACFEQNIGMPSHIVGKPLVNKNIHTVTSIRNCTVCVSPVATSMDSLSWLAKRIGPLLSARYIVPSLLATLVVCYEVEKRIELVDSRSLDMTCSFDKNSLSATNQIFNWPLIGDELAVAILQCLKRLVDLYGVSFVSFVYLPFVRHTIKTVTMTMGVGSLVLDASESEGVCFNQNLCTWNARTFGSLVAALTFLHQLITFIPDSLLLDLLQDSVLQDLLTQAIRIAGRHDCSYPGSSRGRRVLLYRLIDCIYVLGRRVGFELTRTHMTSLFQMFFALFDRVPCRKERTNLFQAEINTEYSVGCPPFLPGHYDTHRPSIREDVAQELSDTFTPELARLAYIPFCRLAGGAYMDACLYNVELIHSLVGSILTLEGDALTLADFDFTSATKCVTAGDNFIASTESSKNPWTNASKGPSAPTSCSHCTYGEFHLRGVWTDILQQQLEEKNEMDYRQQCYRYHGMRASSFVGHTGKINCIDVMDTENCFLTGAQDNTVQLWSLNNSYNPNSFTSLTSAQNVGKSTFSNPHMHNMLTANPAERSPLSNPVIPSVSIAARLVYREHRKSVFASVFLNNNRLIASCDGHLLLWDPCTGQRVRGGFGTQAMLTALTRSTCPYGALLCADQRGQLFLIDPRAATRNRIQSVALASGVSFASVVRGGLRVGLKNASGAPKNQHDSKIDDPLTRQLCALYSPLHHQSSRSVTSIPNVAIMNNAEGTIRHLATCGTSHVLLCGFTSGLMTALDLRQYQVVKAWQGHANTVVQVKNFIAAHDGTIFEVYIF